MTNFTPNDIVLLLHVHSIAEPITDFEPTYRGQRLTRLINMDLIKADVNSPSGYTITDRGVAVVKKWCEQPLPVKRWEFLDDD